MIPALLAQVRSGAITFDTFARYTRTEWERLAQYVYRIWPLPSGVGVEDIAQEMLLEAWRATLKFDPSRGVPLHTYVVWCSIAHGKRWCQQQRNASWRRNGEPGRYPVPLSVERGLWDREPVWYEPGVDLVDVVLARVCHDGDVRAAMTKLERRATRKK
jgi:DNA-directed RNA polymerase specialized sigma24 family protein